VSARTTDCLTDLLGKFLQSQHHLPSLKTPLSLKDPAYSDLMQPWDFARLIGSDFAFLQVNPLKNCNF